MIILLRQEQAIWACQTSGGVAGEQTSSVADDSTWRQANGGRATDGQADFIGQLWADGENIAGICCEIAKINKMTTT